MTDSIKATLKQKPDIMAEVIIEESLATLTDKGWSHANEFVEFILNLVLKDIPDSYAPNIYEYKAAEAAQIFDGEVSYFKPYPPAPATPGEVCL